VVFPEAAMACFGTPLDQVAEPLDGRWRTRYARWPPRGVVVVAGMFTPAADGRVPTRCWSPAPVSSRLRQDPLYDAFG